VCARYGITTFADIRHESEAPTEGDFSRDKLEAITGEAGYGYRWLGGRFDNPKEGASVAVEAVSDEIAGLTESGTVALLCSATDPTHRDRATQLIPRLTARDLRVKHIGSDGVAEPHQDQLGL
jgi:hypothetical protein